MGTDSGVDWTTVGPRLTERFTEPRWRVQETTKERQGKFYPEGTRGMLVPYITARDVHRRLDELVGAQHWSTDYTILDAATLAVECRLTIGGISKSDVGYPLQKSDSAQALKEAYSDATKRAAIQWGIGRWLYEMELQWVDLDRKGQPTYKPAPARSNSHTRRPAPPPADPAPAPPPADRRAQSRQAVVRAGTRATATREHGTTTADVPSTPEQVAHVQRLARRKGQNGKWQPKTVQQVNEALAALREYPDVQTASAVSQPEPEHGPATDAQLILVEQLIARQRLNSADYPVPQTRAAASELIRRLQVTAAPRRAAPTTAAGGS